MEINLFSYSTPYIVIVAILMVIVLIVLYKFDADEGWIGAFWFLFGVAILISIITSIAHDKQVGFEKIDAEYAKTRRAVFIDTGTDYEIFRENKAFNEINDSTIFYYKTNQNIYGYESRGDLIYSQKKLDENDIK